MLSPSLGWPSLSLFPWVSWSFFFPFLQETGQCASLLSPFLLFFFYPLGYPTITLAFGHLRSCNCSICASDFPVNLPLPSSPPGPRHWVTTPFVSSPVPLPPPLFPASVCASFTPTSGLFASASSLTEAVWCRLFFFFSVSSPGGFPPFLPRMKPVFFLFVFLFFLLSLFNCDPSFSV